MDPRIKKLASNLINYSTELKAGEKVLIEAFGARVFPLVEALIAEAYAVGAMPYYLLHDDLIRRSQLMGASLEQLEFEAQFQLARMKEMDCYIGVRGSDNVLELSDVPPAGMQAMSKTVGMKVHMLERLPNTRWVVLRYPNPTFAQAAKMSTHQFEDFYYDACLLDYSKMSRAMDPLAALMNRTDRVQLKGPGLDLSFSIKDIPAIKCDGKMNIPDGEVFTAPVKDSVNGIFHSNTPTLYEGNYFNGLRFVFKDGKIVEESCEQGDAARLHEILNRDEGARFIGEFAIGLNPFVRREMLDILFDEKIAGSFHFTPGNAYDEADNGNKSQIHWDIVVRQFAESGGGEIWFDGKLIRRDGLFIPEELKPLNP